MMAKKTIKVTFGDNGIAYGQDHRFFIGIPRDINFETKVVNDTLIKLTAPEYGGKPYGNGTIYVHMSLKELIKLAKKSSDVILAQLMSLTNDVYKIGNKPEDINDILRRIVDTMTGIYDTIE